MLLPFALMAGAQVVIMPQFEPEAFCRNIERYKVTMSLVVPPVFLAILHHPGTYIDCQCQGFPTYFFSLSIQRPTSIT
jgi:acyl-coenzyme A synthetase/AMP-(fatty) acid ligase